MGVSLTFAALVQSVVVLAPGSWPWEYHWTIRSVNFLVQVGFLLLASRFLPRRERRPSIIFSASAMVFVFFIVRIVFFGFKESLIHMRGFVKDGIPVLLAMMTVYWLSPPFRAEECDGMEEETEIPK